MSVCINSLSPAPRATDAGASTKKKKNRKKLRYFRLPPNLAHRKLIALANYVPSSSPLRVLNFTQRFFKNVEKMVVRSEKYLGFFFIEWKLISTNFNQMQVKQIVLKDFGR